MSPDPLKKLGSFYERVEEIALVSLVILMLCLGFLQILFRNLISIGIVWIDPLENEIGKPEVGIWQKVSFKLANGKEITGEVDISGYSRVSDYFQAFSRRFYEVYECNTNGKKQNLLLVSSGHVLWRKLGD